MSTTPTVTPTACDTTPLALFQEHQQLAHDAAKRFLRKAPPWADRDDVTQGALWGLWEAAQGFEPERGIKFETYADPVIRGRILDRLREVDHMPRSMRESGGGPELTQFALYHNDRGTFDYSSKLAAPAEPPPDFEAEENARRLLRSLPAKDRYVLWRCCVDGERMKNVADELKVSESRVSQVVKQSLQRLREDLAPQDA